MKITTIQLYENTKRRLSQKKEHPNESYDSVLKRMLEDEEIPDINEMYRKCDEMKEKKKFSTRQVIKLSHELRHKR